MNDEVKEEDVKEFKYEPKDPGYLKNLAIDVYNGKVFTDRHCRTPDEVSMVFMVLTLGGSKLVAELQKNEIAMIYQYLDQAGPRSINGMPNFFSMEMLNKEDAEEFGKHYEQYSKIMDAYKGADTGE